MLLSSHRAVAPLLALFLGLVLASAACFERWVTFEAKRIESLKVTAIEAKSFRLASRCLLHNPNSLDASVSNIRFVAKSGPHVLGRGKLAGPIAVKAKSTFPLTAPLTVSYADLPADFPARVSGGKLALTIETQLTAKTSLGTYTMELVSRGAPRIAEALEVAVRGSFRGKSLVIENYTLRELGLRGVTLDVHVKIANAFAFPLRIRRASYSLDVNGKPFGKGALKTAIALGPRSSARRKLAVRATHGAVGHAMSAIFGKAPKFRVRGTLWIDPIGGVDKIPIDLTADASVFADD